MADKHILMNNGLSLWQPHPELDVLHISAFKPSIKPPNRQKGLPSYSPHLTREIVAVLTSHGKGVMIFKRIIFRRQSLAEGFFPGQSHYSNNTFFIFKGLVNQSQCLIVQLGIRINKEQYIPFTVLDTNIPRMGRTGIPLKPYTVTGESFYNFI